MINEKYEVSNEDWFHDDIASESDDSEIAGIMSKMDNMDINSNDAIASQNLSSSGNSTSSSLELEPDRPTNPVTEFSTSESNSSFSPQKRRVTIDHNILRPVPVAPDSETPRLVIKNKSREDLLKDVKKKMKKDILKRKRSRAYLSSSNDSDSDLTDSDDDEIQVNLKLYERPELYDREMLEEYLHDVHNTYHNTSPKYQRMLINKLISTLSEIPENQREHQDIYNMIIGLNPELFYGTKNKRILNGGTRRQRKKKHIQTKKRRQSKHLKKGTKNKIHQVKKNTKKKMSSSHKKLKSKYRNTKKNKR